MMAAAPVGISVETTDSDVASINARARELHDIPVNADRVVATDRTYYDEDGDEIPMDGRPCAQVARTSEPVHDWTARVDTRDGDRKWVRVDAERRGDEWLVSVADEGVGIDPDDQDRIFEVFQRLHPTRTTPGPASGWRSASASSSATASTSGSTSVPGEGATFYVTLLAADEV